ncbi:hypothetical protein ANME2D_02288 [Candidatus Methanoperedens nitroreducens]|uniref:Uncharacterized protein n=1 Tax=Candidatus Methanoperedens nitratireducens TaxID=1392998 RepID=A0A062V850_9EURY|nr:hypothetical protein ANME2D_02288 [Candidatus Methanoperedens nitroreducens]
MDTKFYYHADPITIYKDDILKTDCVPNETIDLEPIRKVQKL